MPVVKIDACAIIASHETNVLGRLLEGYTLATVPRVIEEARSVPAQLIAKLTTHQVSAQQLFKLDQRLANSQLKFMQEKGETHLWAHADSLPDDDWLMCGPDSDIVKIGCALGKEHKIVAIETLLRDIGLDNEVTTIINTPRYKHLAKIWLDTKISNINSARIVRY